MSRDNDRGPHVSLAPDEVARLARAWRSGARVPDLAASVGVSTRTVYRLIGSRLVYVTLDGWVAVHRLTEEGPVRCGPWLPADSLPRPEARRVVDCRTEPLT